VMCAYWIPIYNWTVYIVASPTVKRLEHEADFSSHKT
jgi:hypothetical protein